MEPWGLFRQAYGPTHRDSLRRVGRTEIARINMILSLRGSVRFLILPCTTLILPGCAGRANHESTVKSARTAIPAAVQMEEIFGEVDHFITHYGFDAKPKPWNSEVHFGGRYVLTMQVDVTIDYTRNVITKVGNPIFVLYEITKIEKDDNGMEMASFDGIHL